MSTKERFLVTRVQTWEIHLDTPLTPADVEAAVDAIATDPSDPATEDWSYSWIPSSSITEEGS